MGAVQPSSSYTFPRPEARIRPVSRSFLATLSPAKPFFFLPLPPLATRSPLSPLPSFFLRVCIDSSRFFFIAKRGNQSCNRIHFLFVLYPSSFHPLVILSTICTCVCESTHDRYKRTFFFTWFQNLRSRNNRIS